MPDLEADDTAAFRELKRAMEPDGASSKRRSAVLAIASTRSLARVEAARPNDGSFSGGGGRVGVSGRTERSWRTVGSRDYATCRDGAVTRGLRGAMVPQP
jgi:hypothetical protein